MTIHLGASLRTVLLGWLLTASSTALAVTDTWTGTSGFEWGTNGNWTGGNAVPLAGDTLIFDSTGNSSSPSDDNLGNAFSIATLNFVNGANAYTLTSNSGANDQSLALTTSLIDRAAGLTETINFQINQTTPAGTLFMGGTPGVVGTPGGAPIATAVRRCCLMPTHHLMHSLLSLTTRMPIRFSLGTTAH